MASEPTLRGKAREQLASFLGRPENLVNVATVIVAILGACWSIIGGNTNQYLVALLSIVTTSAIGQLVVGHSSTLRDKKIDELVEAARLQEEADVPFDKLLQTRGTLPSLEALLSGATSTVDVLGLSLTSLAVTHLGILKTLAERGVRIRLIVTDPDNESLQNAIGARLVETPTGVLHAQVVRSAIEGLRECAEIANLQTRMTGLFPTFSYFGIDTAKPTGRINIEFYLRKVAIARNPIVCFQATRDPRWYSEFRDQFEAYWESAKELGERPARP